MFKNNTTDCFRICFVKQGGGGSHFIRDSKGGTSLGLRGGHIFLRDPKGGSKKNPVNRNENLQTPLLIKNNTSLTAERPATDGNEMPHVVT